MYLSERKAEYFSKELSEITGIKGQIPVFSWDLKPEELAEKFRKYWGIDFLKSVKSSELLVYYKINYRIALKS